MLTKVAAAGPTKIILLVVAAALGIGAISANANDVQYTQRQKMACTPDAIRLCAEEIPVASRVRDCMITKKASLSAYCRAAFGS